MDAHSNHTAKVHRIVLVAVDNAINQMLHEMQARPAKFTQRKELDATESSYYIDRRV